ncbi:MAG: lysine exporter LysO family protein [Sphaerochaetaceae bacterium]|nr:lysine exporter LysO family protein [Sphaerochaetaceae bacterium]MDD4397390.1 lysine exporter LysO family protein [Sphaerochaetaceae bacterium]
MSSTLIYLAKLFGVFFLGMIIALIIGRQRLRKTTGVCLQASLLVLLFCMGVNAGRIDGIYQKLSSMGLHALLLAASAMAGSFLLALAYDLVLNSRNEASGSERSRGSGFSLSALREPLVMVLSVAAGMAAQTLAPEALNWYSGSLVDAMLYLMMGLVGMQMAQNDVNYKALFRSPDLIVLPLITILGSYLGTMILSLLMPYSMKQCLGMVSGFGWYSLSGVLITNAGFPVLGTISFLANLMRELSSFFLVPLAGRLLPGKMNPAICLSGTSSMDFLLPLLRQNYGLAAVPKAIIHGCIMAFFVPLLIPIWFPGV